MDACIRTWNKHALVLYGAVLSFVVQSQLFRLLFTTFFDRRSLQMSCANPQPRFLMSSKKQNKKKLRRYPLRASRIYQNKSPEFCHGSDPNNNDKKKKCIGSPQQAILKAKRMQQSKTANLATLLGPIIQSLRHMPEASRGALRTPGQMQTDQPAERIFGALLV